MKPKDLIKWREKSGYAQGELANILGVDLSTIYRWEKGTRAIPSFLHLALRCLELEGGEEKDKGKRQQLPLKKPGGR